MENREIDRLIAEKVMGWHWVKNGLKIIDHEVEGWAVDYDSFEPIVSISDWDGYWVNNITPKFSINIEDAMLIVEKLNLTITPRWKVFKVNAAGTHMDTRWIGTTNDQIWVQHESLPMAICLASLKIKGVDINYFNV